MLFFRGLSRKFLVGEATLTGVATTRKFGMMYIRNRQKKFRFPGCGVPVAVFCATYYRSTAGLLLSVRVWLHVTTVLRYVGYLLIVFSGRLLGPGFCCCIIGEASPPSPAHRYNAELDGASKIVEAFSIVLLSLSSVYRRIKKLVYDIQLS